MAEPIEPSKAQGRFTQREKARLREGQPVIFKYDQIPPQFAIQAFNIVERIFGKYNIHKRYSSISSSELWDLTHEKLTDDFGVIFLYGSNLNSRDDILGYLVNQTRTYAEILETVETCFSIARLAQESEVFSETYINEFGPLIEFDAAVSQINQRLHEHDLGYRFEPALAQFVRLDSTYLYAEVVEPAITLLQQSGFEGAQDEFTRALKHYRKRELADAIVDANNAFESTMKAVCLRCGLPLSGGENASALIEKMTQHILPSYLKSSLGSLASTMQALPTVRNKTPGAGHGQGLTALPVLDHLAAYAFHLAATNIVFLIEASRSHEQMDTAE